MTTTDRALCDFLRDQRKTRPDRPSVCEIYIYHNNQNMIAIVAVLPNINDKFLSRESNWADFNYVKENRCLSDPNYFESELPFLFNDI
jgi:hypothetical protein